MHRVVAVILFAAAWGLLTLVNALRLGVRDADPGIYWTAVALLVPITAGLFWGSWKLCRQD